MKHHHAVHRINVFPDSFSTLQKSKANTTALSLGAPCPCLGPGLFCVLFSTGSSIRCTWLGPNSVTQYII